MTTTEKQQSLIESSFNLLVSQLAEIGIKPHNYDEEQQQLKYRQWEVELSQGRRRRRNLIKKEEG